MQSVYRVSDSLRNEGEFKASVNHFAKVLEIYSAPVIPTKPDFGGVHTETILFVRITAVPAVLYRDHVYNMLCPVAAKDAYGRELYHMEDSSLFNGYLVGSFNKNRADVQTYVNGSLMNSKSYFLNGIDSSSAIPFPFNSLLSSRYQYPLWSGTVQEHWSNCSNNRVSVFPNGDTSYVFKALTGYSFDETHFSEVGDTSRYEITIKIIDSTIQRACVYEPRNKYSSIAYWENMETQDERSVLELNQFGDTVRYEYSKDWKRQGLSVRGELIEDEFIEFRTMWKNDTLVDVLNPEVIFLKKNGKEITKDNFLNKNLIIAKKGDIYFYPVLFETVNGGELKILTLARQSNYPDSFWKKIKNPIIRKRLAD